MTSRTPEAWLHVVADAVRACDSPNEPVIRTGSDADILALSFEELGFDSLAFMEFCIAIQAETGAEIDVATATELGSPAAAAQHLAAAP